MSLLFSGDNDNDNYESGYEAGKEEIASHTIKRAIVAEEKLKMVAKMLADFTNKHAPVGPSEMGIDLINIFLYIGEDAV